MFIRTGILQKIKSYSGLVHSKIITSGVGVDWSSFLQEQVGVGCKKNSLAHISSGIYKF